MENIFWREIKNTKTVKKSWKCQVLCLWESFNVMDYFFYVSLYMYFKKTIVTVTAVRPFIFLWVSCHYQMTFLKARNFAKEESSLKILCFLLNQCVKINPNLRILLSYVLVAIPIWIDLYNHWNGKKMTFKLDSSLNWPNKESWRGCNQFLIFYLYQY